MRIALVTETFPPEINGVAMTLERLANGLAEGGDDLTVVRPRQRADRAPRDAAGSEKAYREWLVPGLALPRYEGLMMGLPVAGRLGLQWKRERPDVVHIATEGPLGWSALGAAARLRLPISSSFHTNFHQYGDHYGYGAAKEVAVAYLRSFHNQTDMTMVPTHQMRAQLAADGFRNIEVISRGVDTVLFSPERRSDELRRSWGARPDDPVFVYVGRLAKEKNIELAVESFLAARDAAPRARLVLVGDGPERPSLERKFRDFVFAGLRRGEDLGAHYASGDLFLFPSVTETFGNVITEALASGLVVVTYDYAAGREHIVPGENGVLAPLGDAKAFQSAVVATTRRPQDWPAMRRAARDKALSVTWSSITAKFRSALAHVAATRAEDEPTI